MDSNVGTIKTSLPEVGRITSATQESERVRTLALDRRMKAEPGQYVMAWLPGVDEKPFSLVSADPVTLTIARVGPFTEAAHRLTVGDQVWVRGPLGHPFSLPEVGADGARGRLLMVAGGYGVAPLHFLADRARQEGWKVDVIVGARTAEDVIFVERFRALGAAVEVTTDDGSAGRRGVATDAAARLLEKDGYERLYACGPEAMLGAVQRLSELFGVPAELSFEQYMRCGLGVCGTCARQGWLVCRDGPVWRVDPGEGKGNTESPEKRRQTQRRQ